jgi:pyruvate dehydrogenase E2 component (dihydrolipoamide acetyltransferase)
MDRLLVLRNLINQGRSEDSKISLNALFIKLSAMAIAKNPHINVSWGESALVYHSSVDIALAVAVSEGLVAPVVRDCCHRGLEEIEGDLRRLIAKARFGTLAPQDYEGATFTISNLGAWGVEEFTAIINPPGSAILAIGSTVKKPVVRPRADRTDGVLIRSMLRATLSCDHRTIDGAQGAQFMGDIKRYFEEPAWGLL